MNNGVEFIGFAAAFLTTIAFVPQVLRMWRLGGDELSWAMLALFATGVSLWLVYGVLRESFPLMVANGLTLVQVVAMAAIKARALARNNR